MGRLENIIARNQRPNRLSERVLVTLGLGVIVLLILVLMVFTDLGTPPSTSGAHQVAPPPAAPRGRHVDRVLLGTPAGKSAAP